jgi:hypothetical protein
MSRKTSNTNKTTDVVEDNNADSTVPGGAVDDASASNSPVDSVDVITADNDVTEPVAEV